METQLKTSRSLDLQKKARKRIPGVSQLVSKRPEMFAPGVWPGYYTRAHGVETWDLDGNKYIDMSINGIGAAILGFADPTINAAVSQAISQGSICSFNCPEEVELADLLCDLHPWAQMVRYARSGGEAMAIAIRIARSHTRREKVVFCGYHGWHDWYLAANLSTDTALDGHLLPGLQPYGVPRGLLGTSIPFQYNQPETLEKLLYENLDQVAAVVMEPIRNQEPSPGFLSRVQDLTHKQGAVLVFDEITSAFRLNSGGAHLLLGAEPDIAVFAKAMSNGFPMAAIIGTEKVMQSAQDTFISSTFWTERIGPTAALATIRKHITHQVASHLIHIGKQIQAGWKNAALQCDLKIHVDGIPPLSHFSFEGPYSHPYSQIMLTLFTQLMLERGFLASGRFYATFAHTDQHVSSYLTHVHDAFRIISKGLMENQLEKLLRGEVAHSNFKRLT